MPSGGRRPRIIHTDKWFKYLLQSGVWHASSMITHADPQVRRLHVRKGNNVDRGAAARVAQRVPDHVLQRSRCEHRINAHRGARNIGSHPHAAPGTGRFKICIVDNSIEQPDHVGRVGRGRDNRGTHAREHEHLLDQVIKVAKFLLDAI